LFANSIGLWTNIAFYTNATINFFILMSYSNKFTDEFEPTIEDILGYQNPWPLNQTEIEKVNY